MRGMHHSLMRSQNMGAMENKGLNIFNSSLLLATPGTATDTGSVWSAALPSPLLSRLSARRRSSRGTEGPNPLRGPFQWDFSDFEACALLRICVLAWQTTA